MTEHSNLVQDWYYSTAEDRFFNNKDEKPISLLVNDDGRQYSDHSIARRPQPWQVFNVDPAVSSSYRFRLVSTVSLHCPVIFSVEGHNFTVIASDEEYLLPVDNVSSLTLANGERFDILIDVSNHEDLQDLLGSLQIA